MMRNRVDEVWDAFRSSSRTDNGKLKWDTWSKTKRCVRNAFELFVASERTSPSADARICYERHVVDAELSLGREWREMPTMDMLGWVHDSNIITANVREARCQANARNIIT